MTSSFGTAADTHDLEEGTRLSPRFDAAGLVTAIAVDAATNEVLMLAHMNAEALARTIETGEAHYYSRSARRCGRRAKAPATPRRWWTCWWTATRTRCCSR